MRKTLRTLKRSFSLLEIAIGMALTAILLSALFTCFRNITISNAQVQKIRAEKHWSYVAQLRLRQVFEAMETAYFDDESHMLYFTLNNGVDPDPRYCGPIKGTLASPLCLTLISKENEMRKEPFCSSKCSYAFFDPKKKEWRSTWSDKQVLFPLIRLKINGETLTFSLPKADRSIHLK